MKVDTYEVKVTILALSINDATFHIKKLDGTHAAVHASQRRSTPDGPAPCRTGTGRLSSSNLNLQQLPIGGDDLDLNSDVLYRYPALSLNVRKAIGGYYIYECQSKGSPHHQV